MSNGGASINMCFILSLVEWPAPTVAMLSLSFSEPAFLDGWRLHGQKPTASNNLYNIHWYPFVKKFRSLLMPSLECVGEKK